MRQLVLIKYPDDTGNLNGSYTYYWVGSNNMVIKLGEHSSFANIKSAVMTLSRNLEQTDTFWGQLGTGYIKKHFVGTEHSLKNEYPEFFI